MLKLAQCDLMQPEVTEEILQKITRNIVDSFHPNSIILFGSYAYGSPHENSDVDLFIVMDSEDSPHDRIMKVTSVAKIPYLPMDIIVRTPAEVKERVAIGDFFILDILQRGRTLYSNGAA